MSGLTCRYIKDHGEELGSLEQFDERVEKGKRGEDSGIVDARRKKPPGGYGAPYNPFYIFYGYAADEDDDEGNPVLYYVEMHAEDVRAFFTAKKRVEQEKVRL